MQEKWDTKKVMHTIRARLLQVQAKQELCPDLIRITLAGSDLEGFYTPGFDDHVKLVLPEPGKKMPVMPEIGERGVVFPANQPKPEMRDYTPRFFRPEVNEMDIDFVVHGHGPACQWAVQAQVGDKIGIAGPRGSILVSKDFDWHVLIGDETAIPAMARRLAELEGQTAVQVFVLARSLVSLNALDAPEHLAVHWVPAFTGLEGLLSAISAAAPMPGRGFVWAAAESSVVKALREYWVQERGHDKNLIKASSYWRQDEQDEDDQD